MPHITSASLGQCELAADDAVIAREGRLRAGVEAEAARGHHDVLHEHAEIEIGAEPEIAVEREDHADGRAEEIEIAVVECARGGAVAFRDAEQAVERPAEGAAPREIRVAQLRRVIGVFRRGLRRARAALRHDGGGEPPAGLAGEHMDAPGLGVGGARRAARGGEDALDRGARNGVGQEAAHAAPRLDRGEHGFRVQAGIARF